jgi:hypothetical protein
VASCLPVVHEAKGLLKVVGLIGHNAHRVNILVHSNHLKHAPEKNYVGKDHWHGQRLNQAVPATGPRGGRGQGT